MRLIIFQIWSKKKNSFESKTLFDLVDQDKNNIDVHIWNNFYDSLGIDAANRGSLPFRVWQIYNEMVKFVSSGDLKNLSAQQASYPIT